MAAGGCAHDAPVQRGDPVPWARRQAERDLAPLRPPHDRHGTGPPPAAGALREAEPELPGGHLRPNGGGRSTLMVLLCSEANRSKGPDGRRCEARATRPPHDLHEAGPPPVAGARLRQLPAQLSGAPGVSISL
eukprot:887724-Lingulodinium_polyedra.AAC.1